MDRNYRNWTGIIGTWTGITGTIGSSGACNINHNNYLFNFRSASAPFNSRMILDFSLS
jgi:hypothetical protein